MNQTIDRNQFVPHSAGVLCEPGIVTVRRDCPYNATVTVQLSEDGKTWKQKRFLSRQKFETFVLSRPTRIRVEVSEWSGPFKLRMPT